MTINLSNLLLLVRILVIPVIAGLFFISEPWAEWSIFTLFVLAALTDFFDGRLARWLSQESLFGAIFDPVADKLLVVTMLFLIAASGRIGDLNLLAAMVIIVRELLVSGLREHLGALGQRLPALRLAKWKTFLQMSAIASLFLESAVAWESWLDTSWLAIAPTALLWTAASVTLASGWRYIQLSWQLIARDDISAFPKRDNTSSRDTSSSFVSNDDGSISGHQDRIR